MRTTERTNQFKRDYKRESKGQHRATLDASLGPVVEAYIDDDPASSSSTGSGSAPRAESYYEPPARADWDDGDWDDDGGGE